MFEEYACGGLEYIQGEMNTRRMGPAVLLPALVVEVLSDSVQEQAPIEDLLRGFLRQPHDYRRLVPSGQSAVDLYTCSGNGQAIKAVRPANLRSLAEIASSSQLPLAELPGIFTALGRSSAAQAGDP